MLVFKQLFTFLKVRCSIVKVIDSDKHSNLIKCKIDYSCKRFIVQAPGQAKKFLANETVTLNVSVSSTGPISQNFFLYKLHFKVSSFLSGAPCLNKH
jgi:hypothetical protein